jgi:hypothetical protein
MVEHVEVNIVCWRVHQWIKKILGTNVHKNEKIRRRVVRITQTPTTKVKDTLGSTILFHIYILYDEQYLLIAMKKLWKL